MSACIVAAAATGCFAEPSPLPTVKDFLVAWQNGNYAEAAAQTDGDHKAVAAALAALPAQLDLASLHLALRPVVKNGDNATAKFRVNIDLGEAGQPWDYGGQMRLHRSGGKWKVMWSPSIIHPRLGPGQRLAVVTETPRRAPVQDAKGRPLLKKTKVQVFGVVPGSLKQMDKTLSRFAKITDLDKDRLVGRVHSAPPQSFLPLVTLQLSAGAKEATQLRQVPGVESRVVSMPVAPATAPELVGQLGPATAVRLQQVGAPFQPGDTIGVSGLQLLYQRLLAGRPTVKVVAQDPSGANTQVLAEWPGRLSAPVRTTLDRSVQSAAEHALAGLRAPASMVAVHAATGEVLGVANHRTGGHNRAFEGRYAPGMTFSIVTTQALLQYNQNLKAPLACPKAVDVGDTVIRDTAGRGTTFQSNFARGCQTAFASLARNLAYKDLPASAARLGIGGSWSLPTPVFQGSVPEPTSEVERAQATIGEGRVQVSPIAMALAAAAVSTGTWRPPQLLTSPRAAQPVEAQPLDPTPILALKSLMRLAVRSGSARAANLTGTPVSGVTATVNQGGKTISWFVGYRGDVAFAIAVEGKVSAAQLAAKFLRGR